MSLPWLPQLVEFDDYDGVWERYLDAIYQIFRRDFVNSRPVFRGAKLGLKRHPQYQGKECTFWHFISSGDNESERVPDFRRCERIAWPRPIIERDVCAELKVWENTRKNETRILIYCESEGYLVILSKRKDYILPWTAYMVEHAHRRRKLLKEYHQYQRKAGASSP